MEKKEYDFIILHFNMKDWQENKWWCSEMIYLTLSYVIIMEKYIVL